MSSLIIYFKTLSQEAKNIILDSFDSLGVAKSFVQFRDVEYDGIDVSSEDFIFCLDRTYQLVSRELVKKKILKSSQLIGQDVVDAEKKFALFSLPTSEAVMFSTEEEKQFTWDKFVKVCEAWKDFFGSGLVSPVVEIDDERGRSVRPTDTGDSSNISDIASDISEGLNGQEIILDYFQVVKELVSQLDLTNPSLGKTLKGKVRLSTPNGDVYIWPPGRILPDIPEDHNIAFKDMLVLLKSMQIFGVDKIAFTKE